MNTTQQQKEMLLQWMKLHPEVARGRLRRKGESKTEMEKMLEELANTMNCAQQGPTKSSSEWLKTWKDWKMNVLKKETKRRNSSLQTGGGSPQQIRFSLLEENLLEFLTPEAVGLDGIPQGGIYYKENQLGSQEAHTSYTIEMDKYDGQWAYWQNKYVSPKTILRASKSTTNTDKETKLQPATDILIKIEEEKLKLKKEGVDIQRELLEVQKNTLREIQNIRNVMDTFGSLQ